MKKIFYWSPCLTKVGTYKSTINSALSLSKYSNKQFSIKVINVCGEWNEEKDILKNHNIGLINLGFNYFNYLPKNGFILSRFSYLVIIFLSIFPFLRMMKKRKSRLFNYPSYNNLTLDAELFFF